MGGIRRAARRDANHGAIRDAARKCGASWLDLPAHEAGTPDALVGYCGITDAWEIKDGSRSPSGRRLRSGQVKFAAEWKGRKPVVIKSVEEAVARLVELRKCRARASR